MDASFESLCPVGSVGSDILKSGGSFFFQRLRVESDETKAFVVRSDGDFVVFYLLFDDF